MTDGTPAVKGFAGLRPIAARPLTADAPPAGEECMNTTKTPTRHRPRGSFLVLDLALRAAGTTILLLDVVPPKFRSLVDQARRAAASVPANIAEGDGRLGRDRRYHLSVAYGSAKEVDVHLRLLLGLGAIDRDETEAVLDQFDQVRAILWRLMHPLR